MTKRSNSKAKVGNFDFHFIVDRTPSMLRFVKDADDIGRNYTEHFRRLVDQYYQPKDQ